VTRAARRLPDRSELFMVRSAVALCLLAAVCSVGCRCTLPAFPATAAQMCEAFYATTIKCNEDFPKDLEFVEGCTLCVEMRGRAKMCPTAACYVHTECGAFNACLAETERRLTERAGPGDYDPKLAIWVDRVDFCDELHLDDASEVVCDDKSHPERL